MYTDRQRFLADRFAQIRRVVEMTLMQRIRLHILRMPEHRRIPFIRRLCNMRRKF